MTRKVPPALIFSLLPIAVGAISYAILRIAYAQFYGAFGVVPEEIGWERADFLSAAIGIKVIISAGKGQHEIKSPSFGSREEAEGELEKVRGAQESGDMLRLPWISALGGNVVAAYLDDRGIFVA